LWGYCVAVIQDGWRWIVDAQKNDGKRYIVQSDELLSAFLELQRVTREISPRCITGSSGIASVLRRQMHSICLIVVA